MTEHDVGSNDGRSTAPSETLRRRSRKDLAKAKMAIVSVRFARLERGYNDLTESTEDISQQYISSACECRAVTFCPMSERVDETTDDCNDKPK